MKKKRKKIQTRLEHFDEKGRKQKMLEEYGVEITEPKTRKADERKALEWIRSHPGKPVPLQFYRILKRMAGLKRRAGEHPEKRQTVLEDFGVEIPKLLEEQEKTLREYRRNKREFERELNFKRELADAILKGEYHTEILGQGRQYKTKVIKYKYGRKAAVIKISEPWFPEKGIEGASKEEWDEKIRQTQEAIEIHKRIEKALGPYAARYYGTQISFGKNGEVVAVHVMERGRPLQRYVYEKRDGKWVKVGEVPVNYDDIRNSLPDAVRIIFDECRAGIHPDPHPSNLAKRIEVRKKEPEYMVIDTFHDEPLYAGRPKFEAYMAVYLRRLAELFPKEYRRLHEEAYKFIEKEYGRYVMEKVKTRTEAELEKLRKAGELPE